MPTRSPTLDADTVPHKNKKYNKKYDDMVTSCRYSKHGEQKRTILTSKGGKMYERTNRQFFIDNFHKLDMVTAPCGIKFFGENHRYCEHTLMTRSGKLLGKEITDGHGVKETEYYKAV